MCGRIRRNRRSARCRRPRRRVNRTSGSLGPHRRTIEFGGAWEGRRGLIWHRLRLNLRTVVDRSSRRSQRKRHHHRRCARFGRQLRAQRHQLHHDRRNVLRRSHLQGEHEEHRKNPGVQQHGANGGVRESRVHLKRALCSIPCASAGELSNENRPESERAFD
jgi:hypothetical protein